MLFIQRISSFLFSMYWLLLSFLSIEHFSPSSSSHPVGKPTVFSWQSVYCLESLFLPLQHYPWVNWIHSLCSRMCNTGLPALSETSWNVEILLQFFSLTQLRSHLELLSSKEPITSFSWRHMPSCLVKCGRDCSIPQEISRIYLGGGKFIWFSFCFLKQSMCAVSWIWKDAPKIDLKMLISSK